MKYNMNNFFTRFKNFLHFRTNIRIFSVTKDSLSNYKSTINFKLIKIKNYKEIEGLIENRLVKKQLSIWKKNELVNTINEINDLEISCKKNPQISPVILFNFLTKICKKVSY